MAAPSSRPVYVVAAVALALAAVAFAILWLPQPAESDANGTPPDDARGGAESIVQALDGCAVPGAEPRAKVPEPTAANREGEAVALDASSSERLHGRVLDFDGAPLPDAAVEIAEDARIERGFRCPEDARFAKTDIRTGPDGRFSIGVPRGMVAVTFLRFVHEGFSMETAAAGAAVKEFDGSLRLDDVVLKALYFVQGIVVDGQGRPVAGCAVAAPAKPWDERTRWTRGELVHTDGEGRFRIGMKSNAPVRATAWDEDHGAGWSAEVVPSRGRDIPELRILLHNGGDIAGRLLDAAGAPAAAYRVGIKAEIGGVTIRRFMAAEDDGAFRFSSLPDAVFALFDEPVGVAGNVGEREDRILAEHVAAGTEDLVLRLPPTSRIALHLRDAAGQIVDVEPGISVLQIVRLSGEEDDSSCHVYFQRSGRIEHPEPGTFIFGGFEQGTYYLDIRVVGYADLSYVEAAVPPPPGMADVHAALKAPRSIKGTVRLVDGRDARGVCVACEPEDSWLRSPDSAAKTAAFLGAGVRGRIEQFSASLRVTDDAGAFSFENVARTGRYRLIFSVNGFEIHQQWPVEITEERPQAVVSVTLPEASGSIEGVVLDPYRSPLLGALVVAWDGGDLFQKCRSDEEGRYRFGGMPDGRYVVDARVLASAVVAPNQASYYPLGDGGGDLDGIQAFNAVIREGGICKLDLVIADPWNSMITGRIDPGRQPFPDNMVVGYTRIHPEDEPYDRRRPTAADLFHYVSSVWDEDPRIDFFRFTHLPAGRYRVRVEWMRPDNQFTLRTEPFELGPSAGHEMTIRLALVGLAGEVVDGATGEGVEGAKIVLESGTTGKDLRSYEIESGRGGAFSSRCIPAGTYDLFAAHASYAPRLQRNFLLDEGGDRTGVRVELEPGCSVSGKLKLAGIPDGEEQPSFRDYYAYIECPETGRCWPRVSSRVEQNGAFRLTGLPHGAIKIIINGPRDVEVERAVTLPAPEDQEIVIEVPPEPAPSPPAGGGSSSVGSF